MKIILRLIVLLFAANVNATSMDTLTLTNPQALSALGTPANGTVRYCSDCQISNPCTGGGSGAVAKREAGAWNCGALNAAPAVSTQTTNYAPSASQSEVVLCNATLTVTLPTAVGNAYIYTVKSITSSGVVTVATTGGQTIEGSSSLIISVQYTSVDLISDGTNWSIL